MHRLALLIIFILTLLADDVAAQHRFPPHPHRPGGRPHSRPHVRRVRVRQLTFRGYPNIFSGTFSAGAIGTEVAACLGIDCEHFIDRAARFSFSIPVSGYVGGPIELGEFGSGDTRARISGAFTAPAFRYHPFGNTKHGDVGLGIALGIGAYNRDSRHMDSRYQITHTKTHETFTALLFQISNSIHSSGAYIFNINISGGPMLSGNVPGHAMLQIGIKMGSGF